MQAMQKLINRKNCSSDSRSLKKGEVFFDLGSDRGQYGKYFYNALKKKPFAIITQKLNTGENLSRNIYSVNNINFFYKKSIFQKYKKTPKYKVAVTGTNGKTSIAHFYYKILNFLGIFENNKKNKNNLTTPSFLDNHKIFNSFYKKKINHSIIEASSHGLKQSRLELIDFHCGIFTNLTHDHLDYHLTMKDYLNSKMILFKKLVKKNGFVIANTDVAEFSLLQKIAKEKKLKILSYGTNGNTIKIISVKVINNLTQLKINVSGKIYILKLQLIGNFQIENFLSAILACFSCGIAFEKIFSISSKITNPPGRMQFIKQDKKLIIIDYAHTPDALQKTILEIKSFFKRKVNLVFGCGGNRDRAKRKAMGKIAQKLCNKIYITDDNPRYEDPKKIRNQIKAACPSGSVIAPRNLAIKKAIQSLKNEILLIAGKGHENYQLIKNKKISFSDYACAKKYLR
jgi:UDP-N-acetylmuramoyl-L-alanyl-D-glutamate--2,6-diaminopimelate ligase